MANKVEEAIRGLLEFFSQCLPDLHVRRDTLDKPISFQVKRMYSSILIFTGFKSEKQLLNDFEAVSGNDLLMSGRRTRALNSIMANFLQNVQAGMHWTLRDLSYPDRNRTLIFLNVLIDYARFARDHYLDLDPLFVEKKRVENDNFIFQQQSEQLSRNARQKRSDLDHLRRKKMEQSQQRDVRRNEAMAKKAQTDGVKHEHDLLERQTEEKVQNKTALLEKVREAEESIDELKRRLVRSPDRLRKEIRELEITNSDRAQSVHALEMSISHLKQKVEALQRDADHHCEQFGIEFNDVRNDLNALHEASRRHNHLVMRVDQKTAARVRLEQRIKEREEELRNQIEKINGKIDRLQRAIEHQQQLLEMHQQNTNHATENLDKSNRESCQHKMDIETLKQEVAARNLDASRYLVVQKKRELEAFPIECERSNEQLKAEIIDICHAISELRRHFVEHREKAEAAVEKFVE